MKGTIGSLFVHENWCIRDDIDREPKYGIVFFRVEIASLESRLARKLRQSTLEDMRGPSLRSFRNLHTDFQIYCETVIPPPIELPYVYVMSWRRCITNVFIVFLSGARFARNRLVTTARMRIVRVRQAPHFPKTFGDFNETAHFMR